MKNVSFVIVSYCTRDLLRRAYNSVRIHYPESPIIIIDGSPVGDPCFHLVNDIKRHHLMCMTLKHNIGHGRGMDIGIRSAKTPFVIVMDSDAEIQQKCVDKMIALMTPSHFGAGLVLRTTDDGINDDDGPVKYLHPYFAVINRENYLQCPPFIHHGAPCIETMRFLGATFMFELAEFDVKKYILHKWKGTRRLQPKEFHSSQWDTVKT